MSNFIELTFLYYKYLLKKRVFVNCVIILLLLGFILVPNHNANYVTFYIGNIAATSNKFWIGNLAAMFSNVIISFLLLFIIIGEREKEVLNYNFTLEDTSPYKNYYKNSYKIIALFLVSLTLLAVLNLSLVLVNFEDINMSYYFIALIYYSFSYLFFLSVFAFFIEYFVIKRTIKYIFYIVIIFLFLFNDKYLFDLIGINELHTHFNQIVKTKNHFAFGYLTKSANIKLISFNHYLVPLYFYKKIIWFLIGFIFIIFFSRKKISRKLSSTIVSPFFSYNSISDFEFKSIDYNNNKISKNNSIKNIIIKDIYLFSKSFTTFNLICIFILWCSIFFVPKQTLSKILPIIFLFTLPINEKFLCKLFFYNLDFQEKISPFKKSDFFYSKLFLVISFYTLLLIPHLLTSSYIDTLSILTYFSILTFFQIKISEYYKNNILLDILLIIIYTSYLTGYPIINIFQL